ncbi:hypothetical protein [uncultured Roseovarius sp.]|uniref:hypothetical protein n=1 Tax=uncultured Roseovarius sp. TaxID=293344 RepID=UPI0026136EFF|nr:hypothetical protein [uncultured Roseovarius sp.]
MRLIFAVFQMPFWVFLAAAGGLFYLGELSHRDTLAQNQEMKRALAGSPPETVSLAEFSRSDDVGLADEISVQGVIDPSYNYELTKKRKGPDTTRFMYVLFDASDPEGSKVARSALVLSQAEKDKFINEYFDKNSEIGIGEDGFVSVITFNGQARNSSDLSSLVSDAFAEQSLIQSDDFIYIEPFLDGRVAGLTPTVSADDMRNIIRGVGLAVALIGLIKFALRRRKKRLANSEDAPAAPEHTAPVMAYADAPAQPEAEPAPARETVEDKLWNRIPLSVKALSLIGVAGFLIYTGQFTYALIYAAIAAIVALQMFAVRKTKNVITGGLARLGLGLPGAKKSDEEVMADVQNATSFQDEPALVAPVEQTSEAEAPKRGFKLSLPGLGRKAKDESDDAAAAVDATAAPEPKEPKRGFKFALPGRRHKSGETDDGAAKTRPVTRAPRRKDAFQSATLFTPDDTEQKLGMGEKIQLFMAKLVPAEREPKAFAGRPDPFERLAMDARRPTAR